LSLFDVFKRLRPIIQIRQRAHEWAELFDGDLCFVDLFFGRLVVVFLLDLNRDICQLRDLQLVNMCVFIVRRHVSTTASEIHIVGHGTTMRRLDHFYITTEVVGRLLPREGRSAGLLLCQSH